MWEGKTGRSAAGICLSGLLAARQFSDLHRSTCLKHGIALDEALRVAQIFRLNPDVPGQMTCDFGRHARFCCADAISDCTAALEVALLSELLNVGFPVTDPTVLGDDGDMPSSLMIAGDGNLYGTTSRGGVSGLGTIFRVTPAGRESVLYSFTGGFNGTGPTSLILASDGNFYGLTINGGVDGLGAIFKAAPH
jgi:uncharacterized repeat protein (TIGR03803 family)